MIKKQSMANFLNNTLSGVVLALTKKAETPCLEDEEIAMLIDMDNGSSAKSQFWHHIAQCEDCYLKWRDCCAAKNNILFPYDDISHDTSPQSAVYTAMSIATRAKIGDCIDDNLMAEFIEKRLDRSKLNEVQQHLASCEDCYANWQHIAQSQAYISENIVVDDTDAAVEYRNSVKKAENVFSIKDWLKKKTRSSIMFTGGSFATAALLMLAIVFSPSQHYTFSDELAMLISETSGFAQPVLLTIKSTPGTRTERTSTVATHSDLAFNAGIQQTFASFVTSPNPQWEESLESMKDVLPPCLMKTGGLDTCSSALKTSYTAGQWITAVFSICTAGKVGSYSSSLSVLLNDLTAKLEAYSVDAKFVESFSAANKAGDQNLDYCTLAKQWIN